MPTRLELAAVFVAACAMRAALGAPNHATMVTAAAAGTITYWAMHLLGKRG